MSGNSGELDHTFTGPIGVEVKGMTWGGIEVPGSAEMFDTREPVRVDATVDGSTMRSIELLPTGRGGHMLLLDPRFRARLEKDVGDEVTVHITHRHA